MNNPAAGKKPKILYIENLRIILSVLVVIVHMACSYGGLGGWSYTEDGAGIWSVLPLTMVNATSQSFFMGMFFLFGAYFTHLSFQKKGLWKFIKDRFVRLGIPLAITYYLISPFTSWIIWPVRYPDQAGMSFVELWTTQSRFGVGVMWFAEALIYFSILYIVARVLIPQLRQKEKLTLPEIKSVHIFIAAILLGLATFVTRFQFPLFSGGHGTNFDLGHFPQYIFLFVLGIMAARCSSEYLVTFVQAKKWMWFALTMIFLGFPAVFFLGGAISGNFNPYFGGTTWQSLGFSMWEQVTGISIMVALIGLFKTKWNHQNGATEALSSSAYAVYVFHPPVIVWVCLQFRSWEAMHLMKFLAITPLAIIATYLVALLIKKVPILNKIF